VPGKCYSNLEWLPKTHHNYRQQTRHISCTKGHAFCRNPLKIHFILGTFPAICAGKLFSSEAITGCQNFVGNQWNLIQALVSMIVVKIHASGIFLKLKNGKNQETQNTQIQAFFNLNIRYKF